MEKDKKKTRITLFLDSICGQKAKQFAKNMII